MEKKLLLFAMVMTVIVSNVILAQHPFNKELYTPIPLQHYSPPKDSSNTDNNLAIYNMVENKFETLRNGDSVNFQNKTFLPSGNGQPNEFRRNGDQLLSFTNLQPADQLSDFGSYPITTIVKLYLTLYNPTNGGYNYGTCSGALINSDFIITAGHCVKSKFDSSYAVACTVLPQYNLGIKPFGQVTTKKWYSFTQWTNNGNLDYDMAILSLSSPIGSSTGWLGWNYNANDSFFTNPGNTFHSFGYPGGYDLFGNPVLEQGERMYYMNGYMDNWRSTNTMCHNNASYQGQSGSALYYKDSLNNRYVYGVLSHGNLSPPHYTCHCRMDSSMFGYFSSIISAPSGIEKVNLKSKILVYPNPSSDKFSFDFSEIGFSNLSLKLFNMVGELIIEKTILQHEPVATIDLTKSSPGVYIVTANIDGKIINGKICKTE